jgi:hypothetical protein
MTDFQSPFEVETPAGAEGWERLYPYYAVFSEDRRDFEEPKFWFHDSMHYPDPMYPFDLLMPENTWLVLNQNTTKVFVVPTALGLDHRVVNGYVYVSPTMITDPAEIERRAAYFHPRAGHYFENWDEIYDKWVDKAKDCSALGYGAFMVFRESARRRPRGSATRRSRRWLRASTREWGQRIWVDGTNGTVTILDGAG